MRGWRRRLAWGGGLLGALAIALALAGAFAPLPAKPGERVYVVPPGTAGKLVRGEHLEIVPAEIRLTLGVEDVLVIRNEDDTQHQVGPIILLPQQTYRIPFRRPFRYQYACTLHRSGQLAIIVENAPGPGWDRLRWRLARYVGSLTGQPAVADAAGIRP
jgi:hypothetical protein